MPALEDETKFLRLFQEGVADADGSVSKSNMSNRVNITGKFEDRIRAC